MDKPGTSAPPPPPGPPPPASPARPPLTRAQDGRWIAGVAAGTARHFGVDPIIVRIAIVALAFLGGAGFAVYGLAWLLIPADGEDRSLAEQWTRDVEGRWRIAGVAAVVLGGALLAGSLGNGRVVVPLLLLAGGAWLLVRSDDDKVLPVTGPGPSPADPDAEPTAEAPVPSSPAPSTALTPAPPTDLTRPTDPTAVGAPPGTVAVVRPPRPAPFLTPLILAVVLLIGGLSVLSSQADIVDVSVTGLLAICLVVVGAGLLVSVVWGRARGLIPLGLVLAAGVGLASLFSFPLWSGVGERIVEPTELAEVDEPIHHGIGELRVDLSDLDLDGERQEVEIGLSIGELVVTVPADVNVEVTGEVSAGSLVAFDENEDGLDRTLTADRSRGGPSAGTLVLDLEVGFGEARVELG